MLSGMTTPNGTKNTRLHTGFCSLPSLSNNESNEDKFFEHTRGIAEWGTWVAGVWESYRNFFLVNFPGAIASIRTS